MAQELLVIHPDALSGNDAALSALAEFLGIRVRSCHFGDLLLNGLAREGPGAEKQHAAIGCKTVAAIVRRGLIERFRVFLGRHISSLLVHGMEPVPSVSVALELLTGGLVSRVRSQDPGQIYEVAGDSREVCGQLSGISVRPAEDSENVFETAAPPPAVRRLVSLGGRPFFVALRTGLCPIFIAGGSRVADVRGAVSGRPGLKAFFSELLPPAMYLKWAFKKAAWNQDKSRACLIVDDPLLKESHGFLNFRRLVDLMDSLDFSTSVGFIPWNFRRTSRRTADLFKARRDRLSLCVHGCDHTQGEFGLSDLGCLDSLITTATLRMKSHETATGVSFDNVMVFPQGIFSIRAMEALKSNNYVAAVNLDAFPVDFQGPLELGNFLEPALTAFGGFPLFLRRCPEEVAEIAADLFWGKPALIMAHHDFFKDGYAQVAETIGAINAMDSCIEWLSLGDVIKRSHLSKEESAGTTLVKGYVAEMVLLNPTPLERNYIVTKKEPFVPQHVSLSSGRPAAWEHSSGELRLNLTVGPHGCESVFIAYPEKPPYPPASRSLGRAMATRARRYLSEIRDNYISKNRTLLCLATKLKNRFLS